MVRSPVRRNGHTWTWQDPKWQCSSCGQTAKKKRGGPCNGGVSLANVHVSHALSSARSPDPEQLFPVIFCARCGGTKTGSSGGLHKACRNMSTSAAVKRLKYIGEGRHPYTGKKWEVFGPLVRGGGQLGLGKTSCTDAESQQARATSPRRRAIPNWTDSPGWAVDEHMEPCLGVGLVSTEAVHVANEVDEEVAELARLDVWTRRSRPSGHVRTPQVRRSTSRRIHSMRIRSGMSQACCRLFLTTPNGVRS